MNSSQNKVINFHSIFKLLFNRKDQLKILILSIVQNLINLIDLLAIFLVGIVANNALIDKNNTSNENKNFKIFNYDLTIKDYLFQLAGIVLILLALKTMISIILTKKLFVLLSEISARVTKNLLEFQLIYSKKYYKDNTQEKIHTLTYGVDAITLGMISSGILIFSDATLITILLLGGYFINPFSVIFTILLFGTIGIFLNLVLIKKSKKIGYNYANKITELSTLISEVFSGFKEFFVYKKLDKYIDIIYQKRKIITKIRSELNFLPYISKYVLEISVVIILSISFLIQSLIRDKEVLITSLSIFIALSTRVAPAVLRIQQNLLQYRNSLDISMPTINLLLEKNEYLDIQNKKFVFKNLNLRLKEINEIEEIKFCNVSFKFEGEKHFVLRNISFSINSGEFVAIVGPSGSGKSTLAELILGIIEPNEGEIVLCNLQPKKALEVYKGQISYLPQNPVILNSTIEDNILLDFDSEENRKTHLDFAFHVSGLNDLLNKLELGLQTKILENGKSLSGGEKQRIGLARAIITQPKILILDESTSALDPISEKEILNKILNLDYKKTFIFITHKLSSIKNADKIIYLDNGKILGIGTYDELKKSLKNFDEQTSTIQGKS